MRRMIADPELAFNHLSHPLGGPDLSTQAERLGSFCQQGLATAPTALGSVST